MDQGAVGNHIGSVDGVISRRTLLKTTAALAVLPITSLVAEGQRSSPAVLAYVGAYTPNGQGIHLCSLDLSTGAMTQVKVAAAIPNPSWLALHPTGNFLYAVNEISNFGGGTSGSVTALAVNRANGDLSVLNAVSSQGGGPAHVSVDPLGQFVFVANYGGGSFAVLPILSDGSLGSATDVHIDAGAVGPTKATNAPPGSFAISGHDAPHAHMIQPDLSGKFVFGTDLGQDRIYSWLLDRPTGKLLANAPAYVAVPPGDGPRHFAFHPSGALFYSLQEEASTLLVYRYDATTGSLTLQQMLSTLPTGFVGTSFASEIRVSPDGSLVFAANRLHDTVAIFGVDRFGMLSPLGEFWTQGDYPRSFTVDPSGTFMVVCNQRSDALTTYRITGSTRGFVSPTGFYAPVGSPACVVFLT